MEEMLVLKNPQKFNVGIVTYDKKEGVNIAPGSFALVTQRELNYLDSTSTLLRRGILFVEENDEAMQKIGIDMATNPNFISDEEIKKKLSGTTKKMKEWLDTVTEGYILDRIYDVAMGMNLSIDKVNALSKKMPDKKFMDE
jgi:hypothetical protein